MDWTWTCDSQDTGRGEEELFVETEQLPREHVWGVPMVFWYFSQYALQQYASFAKRCLEACSARFAISYFINCANGIDLDTSLRSLNRCLSQ